MTDDDRWPDNRCVPPGTRPNSVLDRLRVVIDEARDERPIQEFLARHPYVLSPLLPPGRKMWAFDRPRFGAEFIPDFLLATETSSGVQWRLIELESPTKQILTQAGTPTAALTQALSQVRDWRGWIRANVAYAQGELRLANLDAECSAFVVIGRRGSIPDRHTRRYAELSRGGTEIMTYDRLLDAAARWTRMETGDG